MHACAITPICTSKLCCIILHCNLSVASLTFVNTFKESHHVSWGVSALEGKKVLILPEFIILYEVLFEIFSMWRHPRPSQNSVKLLLLPLLFCKVDATRNIIKTFLFIIKVYLYFKNEFLNLNNHSRYCTCTTDSCFFFPKELLYPVLLR